jgi:IS4 transposase
VLDPTDLPPFVVADLYRRRWRIEEAFSTVKRLLGLSYLWTGSLNGIQLQIWATWLFYAVLVDLGDAVANEVGVPFEQIYARNALPRAVPLFYCL